MRNKKHRRNWKWKGVCYRPRKIDKITGMAK